MSRLTEEQLKSMLSRPDLSDCDRVLVALYDFRRRGRLADVAEVAAFLSWPEARASAALHEAFARCLVDRAPGTEPKS